jgi:hypothetical protein
MKTPSLENVEVWGIVGLGVIVIYAIYQAEQATVAGVNASVKTVSKAVDTTLDWLGFNGPKGASGSQLPTDASVTAQAGAAANDLPGPGQLVDWLGSKLSSWASPNRGGSDPAPDGTYPGSGVLYNGGDQTQIPSGETP